MQVCGKLLSMLTTNPFTWPADWGWGCHLIVLTAVIHVMGLGVIKHMAFAFPAGRAAIKAL
jgi:hypothetical protein